jgi:hypothetical protein
MTNKKYLLNGANAVQLTPDGSIATDDIERVILCSYGYTEETPPVPGTGLWSLNGKNAYITIREKHQVSSEEFSQLSASLECTPLDVFADVPMAQDLMRRKQIHLTPMPFKNGSLVGLWRAERLTPYRPFDLSINGLLVNEQQPLSNESTNFTAAIMVLACRIMGIGKQAYISFPNGAEGEPILFYSDPELAHQFAVELGKTVFAAPELDKFALIRPPLDEVNSAKEVARAQCRAALAPEPDTAESESGQSA